MPDFGFATVAAITVICYLVAQGIKATKLDNKWLLPIIGIAGGLLGYLGMGIIPEFPASDPMTAIAVGIVSGAAATWVNQGIKQFKSSGSEQ